MRYSVEVNGVPSTRTDTEALAVMSFEARLAEQISLLDPAGTAVEVTLIDYKEKTFIKTNIETGVLK